MWLRLRRAVFFVADPALALFFNGGRSTVDRRLLTAADFQSAVKYCGAEIPIET